MTDSGTIDLRGRVVLVTGASSGIGASTARLLNESGAQPVLAARRVDRLQALSNELGGALWVATDVRDSAQVRQLVDRVLDRHGRLDGLVNNAGVALHRRIQDIDLDEFADVLALNVVGLTSVMQAVIPPMRAAGFGRIVNISSGTTRMIPIGVGAYASTKAAVNMLSAVARQELAGDGIDVSIVVPSITATEFNGGRFVLGKEIRPGIVSQHPDYVGRVILRALRTGEERIDIPNGPERPELYAVPA